MYLFEIEFEYEHVLFACQNTKTLRDFCADKK